MRATAIVFRKGAGRGVEFVKSSTSPSSSISSMAKSATEHVCSTSSETSWDSFTNNTTRDGLSSANFAESTATKMTTSNANAATAEAIFNIRRAPASLHEESMHSNTLTDNPLTHRTTRDELAYRRRKLTERGQYERAAVVEEEAQQRDREGRAGAETHEYYSAIVCAVLGYLLAHAVVFRYYYPTDLRPLYAPDQGYTNDVAARRAELEAVDEFIGVSVLESVYSARKEALKRKLAPM